jgi:predicted Zn-dependent peptidase
MPDISHPHIIDRVKTTVLPSGVTLLTERVDHSSTVATGFFLNRGSRDENMNTTGYTHFCEHMLFKDTLNYDKQSIAKTFDEMGGYINAYTTHEMVVLYNLYPTWCHVTNCSLMHEMYTNALFPVKELDLERQVIISEIHEELEDPQEKCHEDFMENCFPGSSLGRSITGSEASIRNAKQGDVLNFYNNTFLNKNIVISVCGDIDHTQVIDLFSNFSFKSGSGSIGSPSSGVASSKHEWRQTLLPAEQVHCIMGTTDFTLTDNEYIQASMLNTLLGESMSSRIYQHIRDDLGLCYSIYTFMSRFRHETVFGLYFSVLPENFSRTVSEISTIISTLLKSGVTREEVELAKNIKIGELVMTFDRIDKRMIRSAVTTIKSNRYIPADEVIAVINSTTVKDLNNLIRKLFSRTRIKTQVLYPEPLEKLSWMF